MVIKYKRLIYQAIMAMLLLLIFSCSRQDSGSQIDGLIIYLEQEGIEVTPLEYNLSKPIPAPKMLHYLMAREAGKDLTNFPEMEWVKRTYLQHENHVIGIDAIRNYLLSDLPFTIIQFKKHKHMDAEAYCKSVNEVSKISWKAQTGRSGKYSQNIGMATCVIKEQLIITAHHASVKKNLTNLSIVANSSMAIRGRLNAILQVASGYYD